MKNAVAEKVLQTVPLDEAVQLLEELIAVNTSEPPGNEGSLMPIIKKAYEHIGAKWYIVEKKKGRSNFIGRIGRGRPSVGLFAHLDTVPPGDGWRTNPFHAYISKGRIYGRGAVDCKGNFASSWAAVKTFLTLHKNFKGTLYLLGCADEENGSGNGVKYLLQKGFKVDYAIVPDGGFFDQITIGEKGMICLLVKSYGKQTHASHPQKGINALVNLISFLQEFTKINFSDLKYNLLFDGVTTNIGTIKGGSAENTVPGYAESQIDIRYPLGIRKEDIMKKIREVEKKLSQNNRTMKITIQAFFHSEPHLTRPDSKLVTTFLKSANELNLKMHIDTMGGNTDAKPLSFAGIETLVHDLKGSKTVHNANEFCDIESLRKAAALYTLTLMKIFEVE